MNSDSSKRILLRTTKEQLNYIVSCIFQTDTQTAADYTRRVAAALTAKMAGAGASAGLLGLVSTFGTASTGAAIAGLSGAAQSTATLYWVGSWVGGGVAAGALLTGGVAIGIGLLAYQCIKSTPRTEESFLDIDRSIVNSAAFLVSQLDEELRKNREPSGQELTLFLEQVIAPFFRTFQTHLDDIASRLDFKNGYALQVYAEPDFEMKVIEEFKALIRRDQVQPR